MTIKLRRFAQDLRKGLMGRCLRDDSGLNLCIFYTIIFMFLSAEFHLIPQPASPLLRAQLSLTIYENVLIAH